MQKRGRARKGQLTLFVIIAILVVAVVVLAIIFIPKTNQKKSIRAEALDPGAYMSSCINDVLEPLVKIISNQGGYLGLDRLPTCIFYRDICRHYLCYQSQYYAACINQEPMLLESIEQQLRNKLQQQNTLSTCIDSFKTEAARKGWQVSTCASPQFNVTLLKGKVTVPIFCDITMSKAGETKKFNSLLPSLDWPLYDFILVTKQVINDEIERTDFNQDYYMQQHAWVEIEKFRTSDGSKIYTLREKGTDKEFVFALRNHVFPPGLG